MEITIEALLAKADESIRFPHSAMRIAEMAGDPELATASLARFIEGDPAFALRLLKQVNSPAFGLAKTIDSIHDAISLVGRRGIADLALVQGSTAAFGSIESALMRATTFWDHSRFVAALAQELALEVSGEASNAFIAGLLHDVGLLLLFHSVPDEMESVLEHSLDQQRSLEESERELFGFDHAELGGILANHWSLPASLTNAIRHHHHPEAAEAYKETASCVAFANHLAACEETDSTLDEAQLDYFLKMHGIDNVPVDSILSNTRSIVARYVIAA